MQGNLQDLEDRLHRGSYQPQVSLRREIPKGNGKTRPLGIACVEDKIVQRAIVIVLKRIYEVDRMLRVITKFLYAGVMIQDERHS